MLFNDTPKYAGLGLNGGLAVAPKPCNWICRKFKSRWFQGISAALLLIPGLQGVGAVLLTAAAAYEALTADRPTVEDTQQDALLAAWYSNIFEPWFKAFTTDIISPTLNGNLAKEALITKSNEIRNTFAIILAHYKVAAENGLSAEAVQVRYEAIQETFTEILATLKPLEKKYALTLATSSRAMPTAGIPNLFTTPAVKTYSALLIPTGKTNPVVNVPVVVVKNPGNTATPVADPANSARRRRFMWLGIGLATAYVLTRKSGKKKK